MPPLISVIMPCYNSEVYLADTVKNVFAQTHAAVELVAVDDGSTDSTLSILNELQQQYPALSVLSQTNQGPYPARNLGLKQAKGEYIAFLDADDYWTEDCLEKLYEGLVNADADLSYCGWQNVVEGGQDRDPYVPPVYEQGDIHATFLKGCPWPIHAALVKKTIVDQVDGFSTRCFSSMDFDFWIRISAVTTNIVQVPEVLAFYRWHTHGQISSVKWRQVLDAWQVRRDFVEQHPALVAHIDPAERQELVNGSIRTQAYEAFWKRDLLSSQQLFRVLLKSGFWRLADLKVIIPALLPLFLYRKLVNLIEN